MKGVILPHLPEPLLDAPEPLQAVPRQPPELDYNSGAAIRLFLEERGLGARKKWGQHFLINPRSRKFLVDSLDVKRGEGVWEIGPGLGAMTAPLLEKGARVKAFEIDPGFAAILGGLFSGAPLTLVQGDVMKTWESHNDDSPLLLGNLPYTIAALLIASLIEKGRLFRRMVVMVQKEVALRMAARPGGADYSSLSVLCASAYTVKHLLNLKGSSFYPPPQVESSALLFELKDRAPPPALFAPLVRALFASRRKTAANNLERFLSLSYTAGMCIMDKGRMNREGWKETAARALEACGIAARERAENLGPEEFENLAMKLETLGMWRKPGK